MAVYEQNWPETWDDDVPSEKGWEGELLFSFFNLLSHAEQMELHRLGRKDVVALR